MHALAVTPAVPNRSVNAPAASLLGSLLPSAEKRRFVLWPVLGAVEPCVIFEFLVPGSDVFHLQNGQIRERIDADFRNLKNRVRLLLASPYGR